MLVPSGEANTDKLSDVLQFMRLLWAVDHGLQTVSKRMKARLGITGPQRLVIRVIGQFPGISAGSLAHVLHLHPSTLTGVIGRLTRAGLIVRASDREDRRRSLLTLTARGRAIDRVLAETAEAIIRRALTQSTPTELSGAHALLTRLAEDLAGAPPRARSTASARSTGVRLLGQSTAPRAARSRRPR